MAKASVAYPPYLFTTSDISINHTLKALLDASIDTILHSVSPRTLQSYLITWKSFKSFHQAYNQPFADFFLLSITFFISHLTYIGHLQTNHRGYLSCIQFMNKLLAHSPQ